MATVSEGKDADQKLACSQMPSHRVQGLALTGFVFLIVVVVLTIIQAAKHDWFIYKGTQPLLHSALLAYFSVSNTCASISAQNHWMLL